MERSIAIIGEGSWGTAVATLLAHNGYTVKLWCHDPEVKKSIETTRINTRYAPDITLDKKIIPLTDLQEVVADCSWIFEAIPVTYLRSILLQCKPFVSSDQTWVVLSKGIEQKTLLLPTQIIDDVFSISVHKAAVMGPSFAYDLLRKESTAVAVAAETCEIGVPLQQLLANDYFRPYLSLDLIGVQVGAALKNIIGLGLGLLEGAGCADNTRAFLVTRGLHELKQVCVALGGKAETVYGLSGVGDLVLSALGKHSKNVEVGRQLGKGTSLQEIIDKIGYTPEGINTIQSLHTLIKNKSLNLPVCQGIYQIVFEQKTIEEFLKKLINKPLEVECE